MTRTEPEPILDKKYRPARKVKAGLLPRLSIQNSKPNQRLVDAALGIQGLQGRRYGGMYNDPR